MHGINVGTAHADGASARLQGAWPGPRRVEPPQDHQLLLLDAQRVAVLRDQVAYLADLVTASDRL